MTRVEKIAQEEEEVGPIDANHFPNVEKYIQISSKPVFFLVELKQ